MTNAKKRQQQEVKQTLKKGKSQNTRKRILRLTQVEYQLALPSSSFS